MTAPRSGRWPEVLVGLLALAALGGVGVLLLGQKPEPEVAEVVAPVNSSVIPASPGVTSPGTSVAAQPEKVAAGTQVGSIPPAPAAPPVPEIPPPVLPEPKPLPQAAPPPEPAAPDVPASPAAAESQSQAQEAAVPAQPTPAPAASVPAAPAAVSEPEPAPAEPVTPPRAGGAVATTEQRTPLRTDYRVMLGTFSSRVSLEAATAGVTALGYRVYAIDVGNQYVAQVGPFADAATTQQAVDDMRRVYARAELYPPRGQTVPPPVQETPAPQPQPETATPAAEVLPPEVPQEGVPLVDTYLQVGAFNNPAGAQQLVEQLRSRGFSPSVSSPVGGKTVVVIGPFAGDALTTAEGRLDAAGFDHFRLR